MLIELIYLFTFILLIDGIKLLYEAFAKYNARIIYSSTDDVSIVIACHNEENEIIKTLLSISKHIKEENIIVVDDGSTDNTVGLMQYFYDFKGKIVSTKNQGKVKALEVGLDYVKTKYVLILDADCRLDSNFIIPTKLLDNENITAVAFNVVPEDVNDSFYKRMLNLLQKHEYAKSMQIGRKSKDKSKSVHCISGAGGLFITERLKKLTKKHSKICPGEDLERTLLELYADGKVIFSDSVIKTDVPKTLLELTKQRIFGWWPGLYRNIYLFIKIMFHKNITFILRLEMLYELFSLHTDVFKVIAFVGLILVGSYLLSILYLVYLVFEYIVYYRISSYDDNNYLTSNKFQRNLTIILYPFYSVYQMILRMIAFLIFIKKKFITKEWSIAIMFLLLSTIGYSQTQSVDKLEKDTDKYVIGLKGQYIQDSNDRVQYNDVIYLGFNNVYTEISIGALNQINVGIYQGPFWADVRFREQDICARVQGELWSGDFVFKGTIQPTFILQNDDKSFVSMGGGVDYYQADDFIMSSLIMKDLGRYFSTTFIGRLQIGAFNSFWQRTTLSINTKGDTGYSLEAGLKFFYIGVESYENYDFNSYDRIFLTAGLLFRIN